MNNKKVPENSEMIKFREEFEKAHNKTMELEKELVLSKHDEKSARIMYQAHCDHCHLSKAKGDTTQQSSNFNEFSARCDICGAELFNQRSTLNYLNSLIDLLGKLSKAVESSKIVVHDYDDGNIYETSIELNRKLVLLRKKINELRSDEYDTKLYSYIGKPSDEEEDK